MNNQPSIYGDRAGVPRIGHQARGGLGVTQHPRISIRANQFLLIDGEGTEWAAPTFTHPQKRVPMMLCVIVGANPHKSKVYYPEPWGGVGEGVPPLCFSDNGYGPSVHSQEPQSDSCGTCYWSKWGSKISAMTNKGIPACSDRKKIAVVVMGDETGHTYELQIPPASIGTFGTYIDKILGMQLPGGARETDVFDVVTAVNFAVGQTGILEFENICWTECVQIGANGAAELSFNQNGLAPAQDGGWAFVQRVDAIWNAGEVEPLVGLRDTAWTPGQGVNVNALPGRQGMPATLSAPQGGHGGLQAGNTPQYNPPPNPYTPPPGIPPSRPVAAFVPTQTQGEAQAQHPHPHPQNLQPPPQQSPPAHGGARKGSGRKPRNAPQQQALPAPQSNVVQHPASQHPQHQPQQAPFLQRTEPVQPTPAPQQGNGQAGNFGMSAAPPPPPGIENALDKAFGLKTE